MDNSKWWKDRANKAPEGKKPIGKGFKKILITAIIVIAALILIGTTIYTVNDKQQAVITTFGKVTGTADPGIHIKLPFGIQRAHLVDVNVSRKIEIGYRSDGNRTGISSTTTAYEGKVTSGDYTTVESESKMITGDYNIVNCDFFLEYKISDPVKYLYNSRNPDEILKSLAQSHIRNVISSYDVDSILTTGKNEIQSKIKEGIMTELAEYNLGLMLTDIKLQDSEPPTARVIEAFKEVETAKQEMETAINVAQAYENSELPKAEANADKILKEAEYQKQDRINEANMQVSMFSAMYEQYANNPEVTRKRMFFETVEEVLPNAKVYIDTDASGNMQKLLPVQSFAEVK